MLYRDLDGGLLPDAPKSFQLHRACHQTLGLCLSFGLDPLTIFCSVILDSRPLLSKKKPPFPFDSPSLSVHYCCHFSFNATSSFDIGNLVAIVVNVVAATFVRFLSVNPNLATNSSSFQSIPSTSNPENPSYSQKSSAIQRFTVASRGGSRSRGVGLKGDSEKRKSSASRTTPMRRPSNNKQMRCAMLENETSRIPQDQMTLIRSQLCGQVL